MTDIRAAAARFAKAGSAFRTRLTPTPPHPILPVRGGRPGADAVAFTTINDDAIWAKNIQGDAALSDRIRTLAPGQIIDLEVDGVVGRWERMRTGKDGRPTYGIKPIAEMREVWARLRRQGQRTVAVREVVLADSYLAALVPTLSEWNSPEDEEAYGDL